MMTAMRSAVAAPGQNPRRRRRWVSLLSVVLVMGPSVPTAAAQDRPLVHLRELRIDSLLLASGLDSARLHEAVVEMLRRAGRLGERPSRQGPALDIAIHVRPAFGPPEPSAVIGLEVGRNLMESGVRDRLVWDHQESLRDHPTWRGLVSVLPERVFRALDAFLRQPGRAPGRGTPPDREPP